MIAIWRTVICLSVFVVLADVILASLYNTILSNMSHDLILAIYVILSLLFIGVLWKILMLARENPIDVKGSFMKISQITTWLLQIAITAFVIVLLLEIMGSAKYTQAISSYSQFAGLVGGTFMLFILLRQLIYSYRRYRSNLLFLYSVAIISTISYFFITTALSFLVIPYKPSIVEQSWLNTHVYLPIDSIERSLGEIAPYFQDLSFVLLWIASGFLLKYHFKKVARLPAFLILISTPALYFFGRFVDISYFVQLLGMSNVTAAIVSIIIRSISPLVGGLIFGLSFYYTSRSLPENSKLRTYLNITGHGFIILLISNQYSIILHYPYPPYGVIAMSATYLGGYLLLVGIYSTALSSAQNIRIHNEISRIVQENSKFSHEMGTAIFIDNIEKQVSNIEKSIEEESGVESTPDPKEIRDYIQRIIEEKIKTHQK
jgi:hypothetical protein